jgi:hypothetical protein
MKTTKLQYLINQSFIRTTWTGKMVSFLAGHRNHLSTPWKHVESPPYRSSWYICPSQDNSALRLTRRHFPTTLMPSRSSTRPFQGLSCTHFTSSADIPLSLFYFHQVPTAIGPFPAYRLPPPLTTSSLDTYINLHPSVARLTHPWWWRQYAPLKRRSRIILHGSTTQKTALNISKLIRYFLRN